MEKRKTVKNPIAKKLTVRVAILLAIALAVLFVGAYHVVSDVITRKNESYAKAIVSVFGDSINQISKDEDAYMEDMTEKVILYEEDICKWYDIDYMYMYIPDFENKTAKIIARSLDREKFGEEADDHMVCETVEYECSEEELQVYNGEKLFAVIENGEMEDTRGVLYSIVGKDDIKLMINAGMSNASVNKEIRNVFLSTAATMLIIFSALTFGLYLIINTKVSRPALKICEGMSEFIRDGKRNGGKLTVKGGDEFEMIAESFNKMTDDIDDYLNNIKELNSEQERQETELKIASNIQKGFLPVGYMSAGDCEIRAIMNPAKNVGGDLYDYVQLDEDNTMIVIADVSGKGMSASLFMSVTLMLIRQCAKSGQSPSKILYNVNEMLSESNPRLLFATAFIGIYNGKEKTLTYANAGHNLPYIISENIKPLCGAENTLLGLYSGEKYEEKTVKLKVGDMLFAYTDGVTEAVGENGFFGEERLKATLVEFTKSEESDAVSFVYKKVAEFSGDKEQHDDVTMISLTVKDGEYLTLDADIKEFERIKEKLLSSPLEKEVKLQLCVAAEEIFSNICYYAYPKGSESGKVLFSFNMLGDSVTMHFVDEGREYDPRENVPTADSYDIDNKVGGLGRLIAFTVCDKVEYKYQNGKNFLTLIKNIKENGKNDDK